MCWREQVPFRTVFGQWLVHRAERQIRQTAFLGTGPIRRHGNTRGDITDGLTFQKVLIDGRVAIGRYVPIREILSYG